MAKEAAKELAVRTQVPLNIEEVKRQVALADFVEMKTKEQRDAWVAVMCMTLGLNPTASPFDWIKNEAGVYQPYAKAGAIDQLGANHGVSLEPVWEGYMECPPGLAPENWPAVYGVKIKATLPNGRVDYNIGTSAVKFTRGGSAATPPQVSNNIMAAWTKARRRATKSILGLGGMLDESEIESMGGWREVAAEGQPARARELPAPQVASLPPGDMQQGAKAAAPDLVQEIKQKAQQQVKVVEAEVVPPGRGLPPPAKPTPAPVIPGARSMNTAVLGAGMGKPVVPPTQAVAGGAKVAAPTQPAPAGPVSRKS